MAHTGLMAKEGIAIIGMGCVLPDAPDVPSFWENVLAGRYSIGEVPPDKWKVADYYHPDPKMPDKTYCKIGGFVRGFTFNSLEFGIPPKVAEAMDDAQKWALVATREALQSAGYLEKPFCRDKTAVILGNALGGDNRVRTILRLSFPEMARALQGVPEFATLDTQTKAALWDGFQKHYQSQYPTVSEDSMPGELANIVSGRIANVFNLGGGNYTTDAACASSLAAFQSAIYGLWAHDFDLAITGGSDHSMGIDIYIKFSKIGALSPDRSCPFDEKANGFVMGEGAAIFLLKRLADAEQDGDQIYAVIRSIGSSSDGKGKGITAPNPKGQVAAIARACQMAEISPASIGLIEAHGTSTSMGDFTEIQALQEVFAPLGLPPASIAIGSVKSQIGHLKSCAGAAGLLKVALSLYHKLLPPTINVNRVHPKLNLQASPFFVNTMARPWDKGSDKPRRAGLSSFGFGGTNFHTIVEEYRPQPKTARLEIHKNSGPETSIVLPGQIAVLGAVNKMALQQRLATALVNVAQPQELPAAADLQAPCRLAIAFKDAADLKTKGEKLAHALRESDERTWALLKSQGVFVGEGKPGKIAVLFPGQGSQYLNMGKKLRHAYPLVAKFWEAADLALASRLGKNLSSYVFVPENLSKDERQAAEEELKFTKITQPAVLTLDIAMFELLKTFGMVPDMAIGHSLGEYAALVAAGVLSFEDSLIAASGRGKEMSDIDISDKGIMASVFADHSRVEKVLAQISGYAIAANINSPSQTVVGGATPAVEAALSKFKELGIETMRLAVSHAFHTKIVAPAAPRLRKLLEALKISPPRLPIISNVTGRFYPENGDVRAQILELLEKQVMSPVLFTQGIETLYHNGARIFIEVGPKKAMSGLVSEILGTRPHTALYANHPKKEELACFTELLAALYAQGIGQSRPNAPGVVSLSASAMPAHGPDEHADKSNHQQASRNDRLERENAHMKEMDNAQQRYLELGRAVGSFLERMETVAPAPAFAPKALGLEAPLVISGIAVGLPGQGRHLFAEDNFQKILAGQNFIESLTLEDRHKMCAKQITRLVKRSHGDPTLELLASPDEMIHLAGISGLFDLQQEFGIAEELVECMDRPTQMGVASGMLALRDAGLPLILHYRHTTTGGKLPSHWALPKELGDETGVIFASAFPGDNRLVAEAKKYLQAQSRDQTLTRLDQLWQKMPREWRHGELGLDLQSWRDEMKQIPGYQFPRKFLLSILPMGAAQLAQWIGARGPNTHVNSACASTSVAIGIAHDWIRAGRCRRVIVIAADDPTTDVLREWLLSGFMALGAATSEKILEKAALPFDRRRNGMIAGMGAAGLVLEHPEELRKRGMRAITELLGIDYANSAFHVSRLDTGHIQEMIEKFVAQMERQYRLNRLEIAPQTMFMSHETYTPARGGSASAEVGSLRAVFGPQAASIVVANTKGFTGHAMGAGIEEVVAVKALQMQKVPPVANFQEADPELGTLNLSQGGHYPIRYALKFSAGFGSHATIALLRRIEKCEVRIADGSIYDAWLSAISGETKPELEIVHKTLRIKSSLSNRPSTGQATVVTQTSADGGLTPPKTTVTKTLPLVMPSLQPFAHAPKPSVADVANGTPDKVLGQGERPQKDNGPATEVLQIVSKKTGYPVEMLELDLDLEADLGIDTVKQAEVFATIREQYHLPRKENLQLRDYPTLKHLIGYVEENSTRAQESATEQPHAAAAKTPPTDTQPIVQVVQGVQRETVAIERLIPQAVGAPLAAPKREWVWAGKTIIITPDKPQGVWKNLAQKFSEQGASVVVLTNDHDLTATGIQIGEVDLSDLARLASRLSSCLGPDSHVGGLVHLAGLADEPELQTMSAAQWNQETARQVKSLFVLAQALQNKLEAEAGFLIAATQMGGTFGLEAFTAQSPIGGGIAGLTKALAKELQKTQVKICDFPGDMGPETIASSLWEEITSCDATVEVCFPEASRSRIEVVPLPLTHRHQPNFSLGHATVFVISGGARGITAEVAKDLAQNFKPRMALLGQVTLPDNIEQLAAQSDQELTAWKDKLYEDLSRRLSRVTPAQLEKEWSVFTRAIAVYKNLQAMKASGATVSYHVCDVTDAAAVQTTMAGIVQEYGKVDVIVHGAGIEESKALAQKQLDSFEKIFDVKVSGGFNLLRSAQGYGLQAMILFSSVAGRFGNLGQTDYAAANDLLNKYAAWLNHNTGIKALAIAWSGWAEVGMAARENIRKIFETSGVTLIPPTVGAPLVREELLYCGRESEVVIAGNLAFLDRDHQVVPLATSQARHDLENYLEKNRTRLPLLDQVIAYYPRHSLVAGKALTLERDLYLPDHAIEGVPVFPGVMGLETFVQAATLCYPSLEVVCLEQVRFEQALKVFNGKSVQARVCLQQLAGDQGQPRIAAYLESDFAGPQGQKLGETRTHFAAIIVMGRREQQPPLFLNFPQANGVRVMAAKEIYQKLFHGPSFQVCREVRHYAGQGIIAQMNGTKGPLLKDCEAVWHIQPLMIELGFQAAGLYDHLANNRMGLPYRLEKIIFYPGLQAQGKETLAYVIGEEANSSVFRVQIVQDRTVVMAMEGYTTITPAEA